MNATVVFASIVSAVTSATGLVVLRHGGLGNPVESLNIWMLVGCVYCLLGAVAAQSTS